jgi:hypothetical protein
MNGYLAASVTTKLAVHPWCDSVLGCLMSALEIQSSSSVGQDPTGAIESGFLVLSGPLCDIRWTICHPGGWQYPQNSKKPWIWLTPIGRQFSCAVKVAVTFDRSFTPDDHELLLSLLVGEWKGGKDDLHTLESRGLLLQKLKTGKESWKRVGVLMGPFTEGNIHWYKGMFKEGPETAVRII